MRGNARSRGYKTAPTQNASRNTRSKAHSETQKVYLLQGGSETKFCTLDSTPRLHPSAAEDFSEPP